MVATLTITITAVNVEAGLIPLSVELIKPVSKATMTTNVLTVLRIQTATGGLTATTFAITQLSNVSTTAHRQRVPRAVTKGQAFLIAHARQDTIRLTHLAVMAIKWEAVAERYGMDTAVVIMNGMRQANMVDLTIERLYHPFMLFSSLIFSI